MGSKLSWIIDEFPADFGCALACSRQAGQLGAQMFLDLAIATGIPPTEDLWSLRANRA
jgi:hypothetical protein